MAAAIMAAGSAHAAPIYSGTVHASASQPAPAGIDPALIGPDGPVGGLLEGPIGLTLPADMLFTVSLTDLGPAGNLYEVLFDGAPVAGSAGATSYTVAALAGGHALDIWDYALSYPVGSAPNGVTIDDTFDPDPISVLVAPAAAAAVPAPGFPAAIGAIALCLARFRHSFRPKTETAR